MDDEAFLDALARTRAGDEAAFASIWRMFNPKLRRVVHSLAGPTDADDLASTVWVEVLRSIDSFNGSADDFRGWLYTIARRRLIDLRRRDARRPQVPLDRDHERTDHRADPVASFEATESTDAALALIGTLPPDQAEAILLRVVADLDVAAVAEIMGKKPGTVRVLAHRGLRRLAQQLADSPAVADRENPA